MQEKKETKTWTITTFDTIGETDGLYTIGDKIKAQTFNKDGRNTGTITGTIVEIIDNPDKNLHQLKLDCGWCVHPDQWFFNTDKVYIVNKTKEGEE